MTDETRSSAEIHEELEVLIRQFNDFDPDDDLGARADAMNLGVRLGEVLAEEYTAITTSWLQASVVPAAGALGRFGVGDQLMPKISQLFRITADALEAG